MQEESAVHSIGKYEIVGTLGRGSQGVVYKAKDPEIGRTVAIKTLRKILSTQPRDTALALERFRAEARSAGNLRHPNIITIFEVNVDGDTPYIVMDYVEGEGLDMMIWKQGRIEPLTLLNYLAQAAGAIDYAHSKGVIHRDIKPSNMLVDKSGTLFVLDFGIASIQESISPDEKDEKGSPVMGSPGYMAPEQILNEKLDGRADLFSLAVVAFESLTGQRPFPGNNFTTVVGNILNSKPISLTSLAPDLPLWLESEIERGLSRKVEDRFSTAAEMVESFAKALGVEAPSGKPGNLPAKEARRKKLSTWRSLSLQDKAAKGEPPLSDVPHTTAAPEKLAGPATTWAAQGQSVRGPDYSPPLTSGAPLRPGDVFTKRYSTWVAHAKEEEQRMSPIQKVTILIGIICVVLAVVLLWIFVGDFFGAAPQDESAPPPIVHSPGREAVSAFQEELKNAPLDFDSVPQGKSVHEMTDKELIGVIVSTDASEGLIIDAFKEARDRKTPKLVEASVRPLKHDSYLVRIEAIKTLGFLGDKRAVPDLLGMLDDHDPLVRGNAAKALGVLGSRATVSYLSSKLMKEESAEVRRALKAAIEKINGFPSK